MKTIIFKTLALENFKGLGELNVTFSPKGARIEGANASGKSSLADAISWVLFGKNTQGQQAEAKGGFALKTIDPRTGVAIPRIDHSVTLTMAVDGKDITLERILKEDWVKKRGQAEEEFKGHTVIYRINQAPVKAAEYAAKVADICDEGKFQLLTRPDYFFSLKWQDQRDMLISMVGVPTLEEAAAGANLLDVLTMIAGEDLLTFKTRKSYELKTLKPLLEECAPKIAGIRQVYPQVTYNLATVEKEEKALNAKLKEHQERLAKVGAGSFAEKIAEAEAQLEAINAEEDAAKALALAANQAATQKAVSEAVKTKYEYEQQISSAQTAANQAVSDREKKEIAVKGVNSLIDSYTQQLQNLRDQWVAENNRQMVQAEGNAIVCPLTQLACNAADMDRTMALKAAEAFENEKTANKKAIEAKAGEVKKIIEGLKQTQAEANAQLIEAQAKETAKTAEAQDITKTLTEAIEAGAKALETAKNAATDAYNKEVESKALGYSHRRDDIEATIRNLKAQQDQGNEQNMLRGETATIEAHIAEIQQKLAEVAGKKAANAQAKTCDEKIKAIEEEEKRLAVQIATIENEIYQADQLHHAQMDELERRVNGLFDGAMTIRLYEQQINGGEAETCTILRDGVRYNDLNTASKAHVGLALIRAVQKNLDTLAPVVIDNAESVTSWPEMANQMLYLSVNEACPKLQYTNL